MEDKKADKKRMRKQAEERLRKMETHEGKEIGAKNAESLLQELRVHQIELEMQNEELRRAQAELEVSRARYLDLYDFAPVGYASLAENGLISEANLTLAQMLQIPKARLVKRSLTNYILPEDRDAYLLHPQKFLENGARQICEVRMLRQDGTHFWARIEITLRQEKGQERHYRVIVSDITEKKKIEAEREKLIKELQEALAKVKLLSGLLPICSSCKKIRDDKGYWRQIEAYIRDHTEAEFSHALCPECAKKLYPDYAEFLKEEKESSQTTEK